MNITKQHIRELEDKARHVGDRAMIRICRIALGEVRTSKRAQACAWEDCQHRLSINLHSAGRGSYKNNDGCYLGIDEQNGAFYIGWRGPGKYGCDIHTYIGELELEAWSVYDGGTEKDRKIRWEVETADRAAKPFSCGKGKYGYKFESNKQAKLALVAANEALLSGAPVKVLK